ncbi:MAG: hypothetical protein ACKVPX_17380 [Myxococcaceae bacterium]
MTRTDSRRTLPLILAGVSLALLLVMVVFSLVTGVTQELHEHFAKPAQYAEQLLGNPHAVRWLFAIDLVFLAVYTAFFAALTEYLGAHPMARLGLGFVLLTTVLDAIENHHIVVMLDHIELGLLPSPAEISAQAVVSSLKFTFSSVALGLFGLAIPRTTKLGWTLCLLLTVGTWTSGLVGTALPPASRAMFQWAGFVVGLVMAMAWLGFGKSASATADPSRAEK